MKSRRAAVVGVICFVGLLFSLCLCVPVSFAAEKPVELKVSHFWPETSAMHKHMLRWKEKLEADSKGRLTLRIFSSGVLLKQTQEWDGLQKGLTDIVYGIRLGSGGKRVQRKDVHLFRRSRQGFHQAAESRMTCITNFRSTGMSGNRSSYSGSPVPDRTRSIPRSPSENWRT